METEESSNSKDLTQEDVDDVLKTYGTYQRRMFIILAFPVIFIGYTTMSVIVTFDIPDHR